MAEIKLTSYCREHPVNSGTSCDEHAKKNTFGDYVFEEWVPEHTQEIIRNFWGCFGRTYKDWLESPSKQGLMERSAHGPNPNGFGMPPNGATVFFLLKDQKATNAAGETRYRRIKGRYLHRWNNMGSLIDDNGADHTVSTCDMWVRFYQEGEANPKVPEEWEREFRAEFTTIYADRSEWQERPNIQSEAVQWIRKKLALARSGLI